ncbi:MAG: hypothetical protein GC182_20180 [Rhodopseudomonas sp.]|nr:hypothetical protein [Rhodopseudomonas sp.]
MKTLTTMTAAAALIAGLSLANAQTAPSTTPAPSSLNAGTQSGTANTKSGNETKGAAAMHKKTTKKMANEKAKGTPPANSVNAGAEKGTGDKMSGSESTKTAKKKAMPKETTGSNLKKPTPNQSGNADVPATKK